MIDKEFAAAEVDWNGLAAAGAASEVRRRPCRGAWPERAKQARFLQYRGFSADQIRAALSFDPDTASPDIGAGDSDVSDFDTDAEPL